MTKPAANTDNHAAHDAMVAHALDTLNNVRVELGLLPDHAEAERCLAALWTGMRRQVSFTEATRNALQKGEK